MEREERLDIVRYLSTNVSHWDLLTQLKLEDKKVKTCLEMVNFDSEGILANLHQIPERLFNCDRESFNKKNKKPAAYISCKVI